MLPPRYTIIRRGEHPDGMYFIDEGQVIIRHKDRRVVLSSGQFFGEMALLEGRPRQVTVITLTSCKLLELQAGDFHRLLAGDPRLRHTIMDEVQRRAASNVPGFGAGQHPGGNAGGKASL
jgi:CRP-like cAMP-binding protein